MNKFLHKNLDLSVNYTWSEGFPGNREEPAERAGPVVSSVFLSGTHITDGLSEEVLEAIERATEQRSAEL